MRKHAQLCLERHCIERDDQVVMLWFSSSMTNIRVRQKRIRIIALAPTEIACGGFAVAFNGEAGKPQVAVFVPRICTDAENGKSGHSQRYRHCRHLGRK